MVLESTCRKALAEALGKVPVVQLKRIESLAVVVFLATSLGGFHGH